MMNLEKQVELRQSLLELPDINDVEIENKSGKIIVTIDGRIERATAARADIIHCISPYVSTEEVILKKIGSKNIIKGE